MKANGEGWPDVAFDGREVLVGLDEVTANPRNRRRQVGDLVRLLGCFNSQHDGTTAGVGRRGNVLGEFPAARRGVQRIWVPLEVNPLRLGRSEDSIPIAGAEGGEQFSGRRDCHGACSVFYGCASRVLTTAASSSLRINRLAKARYSKARSRSS